jgi:hypothetical protein
MSDNLPNRRLALDPWVASSLLQKSIRRGDAAIANQAAAAFARYRGEGLWRRLATIAVEDVGIADIVLVLEVVRLATDRELRFMLGSEADVVSEVCAKLAAAPKDRSTDYLYSAATTSLVPDAGAASQMISEGMAALRRCTSATNRSQLMEATVRGFLATYACDTLAEIKEIIARLARRGGHPFVLMLVSLWSAFSSRSFEATISIGTLPDTQFIQGIPAYSWDKHTAVGKQAISRFSRENAQVSRLLRDCVPQTRHIDVALMAAFYADAVPVARRLEWEHSQPLFKAGFKADMIQAGCPLESAFPILKCVQSELADLNEMRRAALVGKSLS